MAATGITGKAVKALNAHLAALTLTPTMPVAWPNLSFAPVATGYLAAHNNLNVTAPTAFRTDVLRGIYQVSVRKPKNGASEPADNVADALVAHFKRGTWLTHDGVTVRIRNSWASSPIAEDAFWFVPVSVDWFVQNNF